MLVIALLAASASHANNAFAESAPVSGKDMLDQAVALYEKLIDDSIDIPQQLSDYNVEDYILKSVVLGYINLDEAESPSLIEYARKQDVMNLLYKTVINYDSSYILSDDEAAHILNECYDNAYIDAENRIAYAFMIKHGIITAKVDTEPNKLVTWDSCRILVDLIYDYFVQEITFTVNGIDVTMGTNFASIVASLGAPDRIDVSDYGYEWYIYNTDADNFCMIGVENGRICGFFTNAKEFCVNEAINKGDDVTASEDFSSQNVKFFADTQGKIDAVFYTSRENSHSKNEENVRTRVIQLLDIINAKRIQNNKNPYILDIDLSNASWLKSLETIESYEEADDRLRSLDIFHIYGKLVARDNEIIFADKSKNTAIGIDATLHNDILYTSFIIGESIKPSSIEQVSEISNQPEEHHFTILPKAEANGIVPLAEVYNDDELEAPQISNPNASKIENGDDLVIDMKKPVSDEYLLEVYDMEKGEYLVNSYITTNEDKISLPSEILNNGVDYSITLSSVNNSGEKASADSVLVSYGDASDSGVKITTPGGKTENDYIPLTWESEQYTDFYIDVYNSNGDLVVSTIIENENEALIQGLDPDKYCIYVTALRKGTTIEKAQDLIKTEIVLPKPVINEFVLDKDDKYYFVYKDENLGVLYFYDEEIIDVVENGKTVKKKKIIQKQVKSTKAYRQLAKYQMRLEYITGDPVPVKTLNPSGTAIVTEAMKYIGIPYKWGGTSPDGFDCSGLVQYVCHSLGIEVDRVTHEQVTNGYHVEKGNLLPGDLIFFTDESDYVHHVGIYIGDNKFIHAPQTGDVVKVSELSGSYLDNYFEARRVY